MTPIRVSMFGGASSLPILAGLQEGTFANAGLDIDLSITRSSDELMRGLLDGEHDVVHAAPGNFIEWRDRTGAEIVAWLGGTSGPLRLVGNKSIRELADLKGEEIAVDAVSSGFVSVLRRMLADGGISDEEVTLVPVGATQLRFEALLEGTTSATMLTLPWAIVAANRGHPVLADQADVLPRLQGSCAASLSDWLGTNQESADAYYRAICSSITWLNDPANSLAAAKIVADRYQVDMEDAEDVRQAIVDPWTGWPSAAMIDPVGMRMVCDLRAANGQPPSAAVESYYTLEPYLRVMGFGLHDTEGRGN